MLATSALQDSLERDVEINVMSWRRARETDDARLRNSVCVWKDGWVLTVICVGPAGPGKIVTLKRNYT